MEVIPDQFDDTYAIMVDDRLIVRFELRRASGASPEEVQTETFEDHWRRIGQGKARIRLDRLAKAARKLLSTDRA